MGCRFARAIQTAALSVGFILIGAGQTASANVPSFPVASSIQTLVSIQDSKVHLQPIGFQPPAGQVPQMIGALPVETSIAIRTALMDMKSGDLVVVAGLLQDLDGDAQYDQIAVQAIESVGLKAVLGTWRSDGWDVIRFEDFNRVSLYRPRFGLNRFLTAKLRGEFARDFDGDELSNFAKLKDLNYTLAPEQGSSYSIFLVERRARRKQSSVYVGRLKLEIVDSKSRMTIQIFNPDTGNAIESMSLSPITSKFGL